MFLTKKSGLPIGYKLLHFLQEIGPISNRNSYRILQEFGDQFLRGILIGFYKNLGLNF